VVDEDGEKEERERKVRKRENSLRKKMESR
jgi:hypothetical protein